MSTTTLTSTTVTRTAQGIPAYATYITARGPPYAAYGQSVAIPVVSQTIDQTGYFQNGWPGVVSQSAAIGNYGGFWGDTMTRSLPPPVVDYNQFVSRPVGRPYCGFLWGCHQIYPGSDRPIRLDLIV